MNWTIKDDRLLLATLIADMDQEVALRREAVATLRLGHWASGRSSILAALREERRELADSIRIRRQFEQALRDTEAAR